jgi:alanyl-tRNA synthetase
MRSHDIRAVFTDYFVRQGHTYMPSSSLVPQDDPSLLFVNAGMVPFKNVFLGQEQRPYTRACSVQKCMRVAGKHNDLEQVGPSPRHHTLFEMLGNFSFGDYYKLEAISYAWELLVDVFKLPLERLWVTVHHEDEEAARLWESIGMPRERILAFGDEDNFWSMGETGPCGPNSEIYYYQGPDVQGQDAQRVGYDDDYMEIWNLVFMQYERDAQGQLWPLQQRAIDTGMGFERITSILQGVTNVYETDLFTPIIERLLEIAPSGAPSYREQQATYRAIADHSRAIAFLLADGVTPGNTGCNYVLRRIIRRASYMGRTLGFQQPFLADVALVTVERLGDWYPELRLHRDHILTATTTEEQRFSRTLDRGLHYVKDAVERLSQQGVQELPGSEAFRLHDTYGFPLDLTMKILAEHGLHVDVTGYEDERNKQRERGRVQKTLR